MSDVEGWHKRQQETERNKKELERIGFAPAPSTPLIVNYRPGADGGIEMTVTDEKFRVKPMTKKQVASLIHQLTGLLAYEIDK